MTQAGTFSEFVRTADDIRALRGKLEKVRRLAGFLRALPEEDLPLAVAFFSGFSHPAGRPLAVGFAAIAAAAPAGFHEKFLELSDVGDALGSVHADPTASGSGWSLAELERRLDALADLPSGQAKGDALAALFAPVSAGELRYLGKAMTGELRIGLAEGLVQEAIAQAFEQTPAAIRRAHQLAGSLPRVAVAARRGALAGLAVELFTPLKPMLATPEATAEDIGARLGDDLWVEDKYDGIRAQAHRSDERAVLYSRTGNDVSGQFPEVAQALARLPGTLILDGELLVHHHPAAGAAARPFFELQKRLGRKAPSAKIIAAHPVALFAFDLLFQDGQPLIDLPFRERRARLEALPAVDGFVVTPLTRVPVADLDAEFARSRARANEGLMVKDPASPYVPGRRGMSWLKYKKALEPLDVVVTGVERGFGKRRAVLSDYTFAVRDTATGKLVNIGKAYTGLTDAEIAEMTAWFEAHTVSAHGRFLAVEPTTVIEVAFEAIQESPRHASGFALRFPRIVRLRPDKSPDEIATLEDVRRAFAKYRSTYDGPPATIREA